MDFSIFSFSVSVSAKKKNIDWSHVTSSHSIPRAGVIKDHDIVDLLSIQIVKYWIQPRIKALSIATKQGIAKCRRHITAPSVPIQEEIPEEGR